MNIENHTPLFFTDNAAVKVKQLIAEEGNLNLKLRVFVNGGGCSGFQYGFTFDELINEEYFDNVLDIKLSANDKPKKSFIQGLIDSFKKKWLIKNKRGMLPKSLHNVIVEFWDFGITLGLQSIFVPMMPNVSKIMIYLHQAFLF